MQTIKITITSNTPTNVVVKECRPKKQNITDKLAELINILDPNKKSLVNLGNKV